MVWPSARSARTKSANSANASLERIELGDLAADMHVDADDAHALELGGMRVDLAGAADRNAEFVLGLAGRDLGVGFRVDVGIDADRYVGGAALAGGDGGEQFELRLGFDIDAENALVDRKRQFARGLADAGEHDLCAAAMPAARARNSSPSETTSAPAPSRASVAITAWLEFAFMA